MLHIFPIFAIFANCYLWNCIIILKVICNIPQPLFSRWRFFFLTNNNICSSTSTLFFMLCQVYMYIMHLFLQIQNSWLSPIADLQTSFPLLQPWSHVVPFTSEYIYLVINSNITVVILNIIDHLSSNMFTEFLESPSSIYIHNDSQVYTRSSTDFFLYIFSQLLKNHVMLCTE